MSLLVLGDVVRDETPCDPPWVRATSGLYVPAPRHGPLRTVDLFCGCGGFSLGAQEAGLDVIAAVEWWPPAILTYLHNLGSRAGCAMAFVEESDRQRFHRELRKSGETNASGWIGKNNPRTDGSGCRAMVIGDATKVTGDFIRETLAAIKIECPIDVVIGGPPCQGISTGNAKRSPADPRNNLTLEFVRIADELGADVFCMENVPPLITEKTYRPLFDAIVERANAAGFTVTANVLDAVNYGVPQFRRRAFIVGTRGPVDRFTFPMPTHWSFVAEPRKDAWETAHRSGERYDHRRATETPVVQPSLFGDDS